MNESEAILNSSSDAIARHHDDEHHWTVESHDPKITRALVQMGCAEKEHSHDGRVFIVGARELIEFIAMASGLNVELRNRKRQTLSPEAKERKRARMRELNAKQRGKITDS
jgi:hypothetical protein